MNQKPSLPERIEATEKMLFDWCRREGVSVTPDNRIGEEHAALIIGFQNAKSLQNLRQRGLAPPYFQRCAGGNRASYRISDLAHWIEISRKES